MSIDVKICGILEETALNAALEGGARYIGFVFCEPSRHIITPEKAQALAKQAEGKIKIVGLFSDPTDEDLQKVIKHVPLDILQLHGKETPERVAEIHARTGLKVMKVLHIASEDDFVAVPAYEAVADYLLFDTKIGPEPTGGTGLSFNWELLQNQTFNKPWMLAGGINIKNIKEAVETTDAHIVDLSSGVEDAPARKNPDKIRALLKLTAGLQ